MVIEAPHPSETRATAPRMPHLAVLDGWRGISIVAVLITHMLPLGPARFQLNETCGMIGMAIFFTLSGFLITSTLYADPSVRTFFIRRIFRIVPAAWLFILVTFPFIGATWPMWRANLFFYPNVPPFYLASLNAHFWSLGVEVQFYVAIALAFLVLRSRTFALIPFACVAVTLLRIITEHPADIQTIYRVDEILSGATLAYLFHSAQRERLRAVLDKIPPGIFFVLLCISGHPSSGFMNYLRPYFAAALVGSTLFLSDGWLRRTLESSPLSYLATISYALYIWHPLATHGWFETGSKLIKYAKRPVGIAMSLLLAHGSTFYFEKFWIRQGKRLSAKTTPTQLSGAAQTLVSHSELKNSAL